ncbi:MAG: hypothetical protein NWR41_01875 [Rickettsiaceae bacterium]|nr:hypothetical protein [Rickettsiaceae bacterium]
MAKAIDDLFKQAKIDSVNSVKKDGTYNCGYKLSQAQIEMAALLQIDPNLEEARKKCYINGFSLRYGQTPINIKEIFDTGDTELLNAAFNIEDAINTVKTGKPAFFAIEDEQHYVTVALVPDSQDPQKVTVQYINSMTQIDPMLMREQQELGNELSLLQSAPITQLSQEQREQCDILQASIINISELIEEQTKMSHVGKDFASEMLKYLKKEGITLGKETVLDRSNDQQFEHCCGLSVASNIAAITQDKPLFKPKDSNEKRQFYEKLGTSVFSCIEAGTSASLSPPKDAATLTKKQPILSTPSPEKLSAKVKIDSNSTQLVPLETIIATTIINNHGLFQSKETVSKNDFANAIKNSQSLASTDRKSFNALIKEMNNKTYSQGELTKLVASSDFVKVQVAALDQIKQLKNSSAKSSVQSPMPSKSKISGQQR